MVAQSKPRIALVWASLLPYHLDRLAAVQARLGDRADVEAIGIAAQTADYAAFPKPEACSELHWQTLFPDQTLESTSRARRFVRLLRMLVPFRVVCIGIPYSQPEVIVLAWSLRLLRKQVVLMADSKFDDKPRSIWIEVVKRVGLGGFTAAIGASSRNRDYLRFLGFRRRPVLPGCDTLSIERIRREAIAGLISVPQPHPFVFVGRFIDCKNLSLLLESYAEYVGLAGKNARRLTLIGSGSLEAELCAQVRDLGLEKSVDLAGFLSGPELAARMAKARAIILPSISETWGLVVNEALALGLPVIVSNAPGSRDLLVRNLINGFVIENDSREGFVQAMLALCRDEALRERMAAASTLLAPLGDVARFAETVEALLDRRGQTSVAAGCTSPPLLGAEGLPG